ATTSPGKWRSSSRSSATRRSVSMRIPKWAIAVGAVATALLAWGLFHPPVRPDPEAIPMSVRNEIAKTGFKATQGVKSVAFQVVESMEGDRWEVASRQVIAPVDSVLTEKRGERTMKGVAQDISGLYVGPLMVVRMDRNRPPLVGHLLSHAFWTSSR